MDAELLLKAGDPAAALESLKNKVRADPSNASLRTFLFQLMAINGDWDKATKQLDVVKDLDDGTIAMARVYEDVINCEKHRDAVFAGKVRPIVFGEPEPWVARLVEAQQALAQGDVDRHLSLQQQAFEEAPAVSGRINDEGFEWLADADTRFGPVLEMMFNQHYYWVPLNRVRSLKTEAPSDLRDLVWLPAEVTWVNGGQVMVMMPARYPGLEGLDGNHLLGRKTEWRESHPGVFEGVGQKMLGTDQGEYPLLQVRTIEFDA